MEFVPKSSIRLVRSMRCQIFILAAIVASFLVKAIFAYEPTGITMDNRVVRTTESRPGPWHFDAEKHEWGNYPFEARSRHEEGRGWFRLQIRPDGTVAEVRIMQSTGYAILDQSAVEAFHRWRFKPGKWKAVDEPMWFQLERPR